MEADIDLGADAIGARPKQLEKNFPNRTAAIPEWLVQAVDDLVIDSELSRDAYTPPRSARDPDNLDVRGGLVR
jgi:hypothetical protein